MMLIHEQRKDKFAQMQGLKNKTKQNQLLQVTKR